MGHKENAVKRACLQLLQLAGAFAWSNNTGVTRMEGRVVAFGKRGSADLIGVLPGGLFLAVETKSRLGRQSEFQREFQREVEERGGLYVLCKTAEELEVVLRSRGLLTGVGLGPIVTPPDVGARVCVRTPGRCVSRRRARKP